MVRLIDSVKEGSGSGRGSGGSPGGGSGEGLGGGSGGGSGGSGWRLVSRVAVELELGLAQAPGTKRRRKIMEVSK